MKFKLIVTIILLFTLQLTAQNVDFKTTSVTQVSESYPCISKDGKYMVYSSNKNGDFDLYLKNLDDDSTIQITSLKGDEGHPDISPDGKQITFFASIGDVENNHREIYIANSDGSNIKRLTNNKGTSFHPKFTPNGKKILYNKQVDSGEDKYEFFTIDIETGNQQKILSDDLNITFASFSPDGTKLLFVKWFENMNTEVFMANADGSSQENISNNPLFDGWPTWSSNGKQIIFSSDRDEKFHFHLYQYDLASKQITRLTSGDRQFVQPSVYKNLVVSSSNFTRDSSSQIISFKTNEDE